MGKFYILVFILSVVFVIYIVNKRMQQKEKEKQLNNDNKNRK